MPNPLDDAYYNQIEEGDDDGDEVIQLEYDANGAITGAHSLTLNIHDIRYHVTSAAPWVSTEVFVQGCYKRCPGCFNPELQGFDLKNHIVTPDSLAELLIKHAPYKCVTFGGGEPMIYAKGLARTAKILKDNGFTIVCYTGYLIEEVQHIFDGATDLLRNLDVLVDGMFIHQLLTPIQKDYDFVGSSNQRIIDVPESAKQKEIKLWTKEKTMAIVNNPQYIENIRGLV